MVDGQKGNKIGELTFVSDTLSFNSRSFLWHTPDTYVKQGRCSSSHISMSFAMADNQDLVIYINNVNTELVKSYTFNGKVVEVVLEEVQKKQIRSSSYF